MLRVRVDYNTYEEINGEGRVYINTIVEPELLSQLSLGLPVTLYDSESLEVDAVAQYDADFQHWYGIPDWSTRRDLLPLKDC
jgi:hypothetical protein